jgi:glyoxylase-like metal-dependent hydrolase (beta-lactamase superfamily II)
MEVLPFYDADSGTFSYLIADAGEAAIIDPVLGFDLASGQTDHRLADRQLEYANQRGWSVRWILETHAHADHLSSAAYLKRRSGAQVGIGRGITEVQRRFRSVYGLGGDFPIDGRQFDRLFDDGDGLTLGSGQIGVMATPGHTNDSVTYLIDGAAFIGDTLFMPDFGSARCDFPGGDAELLFDSIQKIHALPADTCLYMCHDYPKQGDEPRCKTTVAVSRESNIHLNVETSREEYVERRTTRDAQLAVPRLLLPAIQVNIRAGEMPESGANGVSYLKLPIDADLAALADPKD